MGVLSKKNKIYIYIDQIPYYNLYSYWYQGTIRVPTSSPQKLDLL